MHKIKLIRKERGESNEYVAAKLGISTGSLSRIENWKQVPRLQDLPELIRKIKDWADTELTIEDFIPPRKTTGIV